MQTDVTGDDENDIEKVIVKPIYFPSQTKLSDTWGMRTAIGLEMTVEFGNDDNDRLFDTGLGIGLRLKF